MFMANHHVADIVCYVAVACIYMHFHLEK